VLALSYEWRGNTVVTVHNLAAEDVEARLPADAIPPELTPFFADDDNRKPRSAQEPIPLRPYGFRWFRADGERR
jgi:maltose alpha-D-glucosyltransferase/alpha-amylase